MNINLRICPISLDNNIVHSIPSTINYEILSFPLPPSLSLGSSLSPIISQSIVEASLIPRLIPGFGPPYTTQALEPVIARARRKIRPVGPWRSRMLRSGSELERVRLFLQRLNRPAHISEILQGIGKDPGDKRLRAMMDTNLASYARQRDTFTKVAPATFSLISIQRQEYNEVVNN